MSLAEKAGMVKAPPSGQAKNDIKQNILKEKGRELLFSPKRTNEFGRKGRYSDSSS